MQTSDIKTTKQKLEFSEKPIDTHLLDTPSQPTSAVADEHSPIIINEFDEFEVLENPTAKKRSLKDMVTKVPKADLHNTRSTKENDNVNVNETSSGNENVEEDKVDIELESDNYGDEDDDDQPDVQKAHFNQTV